MNPAKTKTYLQLANQAMQEKNYTSAIQLYQLAAEKNARLKNVCDFNQIVAKNLLTKETQERPTHTDKNQKTNPEPIKENAIKKIGVVFHVYHESTIPEIISYISNIKRPFDLIVTTPLTTDSDGIKIILSNFPSVKIIKTINKGRDILPFLEAFQHITKYPLCLKLHTKQGLTNYGNLWRQVSLECLLKNPNYIERILQQFENDQNLAIAGPRDFYLSGKDSIFGNRDNIIQTCNSLKIAYKESKEWAFFAGTMFWFKPTIFEKYVDTLKELNFQKESGAQDGGIEHTIERIFGLIPSYQRMNALLLNGYGSSNTITKTTLPDSANSDEPTKRLSVISLSKLSSLSIKGDVNKQSAQQHGKMMVRGWLANVKDDTPRAFVLKIDNHEIEGIADIYRKDLRDAGINKGFHAFEATIPLKFADGKEHDIGLFDKDTALPVASARYRWNAITRPYSNFTEYLAWSYTGQYVSTPFVEEDKRSFAVMEQIAEDLNSLGLQIKKPPLVSIIMPCFNRAEFIGNAINSVAKQTYINWELIIIDDGSTDNTEEVVGHFKNPNIKYIRLTNNSGVSAARNKGLSVAKGAYIAYLDSDNTWDQRFLSAMIGAALNMVKNADALYCGQLVFAGKSKLLSGVRFGLFNKSLLLNNNFIDLNSFIHKRLINNKTQNFDTSLKRFVDWDLILRIAAECRIASIPVLLSNYYLDVASNSITGNKSLLTHLPKVRDKIEQLNKTLYDTMPRKLILKNGISIVIPSYQANADLQKCLASVKPHLEVQSNFQIELIVVDNNSTKEVIETITSFAKSTKGAVRLIELDKNYGFTFAVNKGIAQAIPGNDVLLLNNDAILTANSLKELQTPLYDDETYGASVPAQILPGGTPTITTHVPYAVPEYDVDVNVSAHHKNLTKPTLFYEGGPFEVDFAPFFCVLIKASTLRSAPRLDELNGRHYRSDRTYCDFIRIYLGLKIAYCPNSIVYHGLQKSTGELKKSDHQQSDLYRRTFLQNSWSESELNEIGKTLPAWHAEF